MEHGGNSGGKDVRDDEDNYGVGESNGGGVDSNDDDDEVWCTRGWGKNS